MYMYKLVDYLSDDPYTAGDDGGLSLSSTHPSKAGGEKHLTSQLTQREVLTTSVHHGEL